MKTLDRKEQVLWTKIDLVKILSQYQNSEEVTRKVKRDVGSPLVQELRYVHKFGDQNFYKLGRM